MHLVFEGALAKNKLLNSVTVEGIEQLPLLSQKWKKLELMMESHELMIKGQVGIISMLAISFRGVLRFFSNGIYVDMDGRVVTS